MKTIISMLALTAACASGVVGLVQPGAPSSCATWHTAVSGDSCYGISQQYSITIDAFLDANPQIGDCSQDLWLGYDYCVAGSSGGSSGSGAPPPPPPPPPESTPPPPPPPPPPATSSAAPPPPPAGTFVTSAPPAPPPPPPPDTTAPPPKPTGPSTTPRPTASPGLKARDCLRDTGMLWCCSSGKEPCAGCC